MFLRKNRKSANGEVYEYWTLCETVRTELGPRQRVVATLGKLSEATQLFFCKFKWVERAVRRLGIEIRGSC
jgi:hypothetical protein